MNTDSHLFAGTPATEDEPHRLPLYEAKMIHQFDHRWATYVDNPDKPNGLDTEDLSPVQKADPDFTVRPRYWVDEREVLARIARVPSRVANAWLAWRYATDAALSDEGGADELAVLDASRKALLQALAGWVAGALLRQQAWQPQAQPVAVAVSAASFDLFGGADSPSASLDPFANAASPRPAEPVSDSAAHLMARLQDGKLAWPLVQAVERQLAQEHPLLADALRAADISGKKALPEFQKRALADDPAQGLGLSDAELRVLQANASAGLALNFLDGWMDRRSPRWLMGWRDITNATNERTVIASVVPRVGVGNKIPLFFPMPSINAAQSAALLGNLSALTLDFVARQKIGGTTLNYFYIKQFPVLPPDRYTAADLAYIVPRVLELTHTAHDMQAWADELLATMPGADPRPPEQRGTPLPPFAWNPDRRAQLRAELDAYYARLYGLTRDELRYLLDPADVMGTDYPSETFRVLQKNELRDFGEYRTRRLVLEAWDRLNEGGA
ncbi:hypothetical protein [Malikia spinosa]|uniref:hypothetical protein n=1 Tax=Malikia spinosa TaxID=86180 RepID=UPI003FA2F9B1